MQISEVRNYQGYGSYIVNEAVKVPATSRIIGSDGASVKVVTHLQPLIVVCVDLTEKSSLKQAEDVYLKDL